VPRLSEQHFAATHNSYEAGPGPITRQLDLGVRAIELDIHAVSDSFQIGHDGGPGDRVFHGGDNPGGNDLSAWLAVIDTWNLDHRQHGGLAIYFDLKARGWDVPTMRRLEVVVRAALPNVVPIGAEARLVPHPGRVYCVLSGNDQGRHQYALATQVSTALFGIDWRDIDDETQAFHARQRNQPSWEWYQALKNRAAFRSFAWSPLIVKMLARLNGDSFVTRAYGMNDRFPAGDAIPTYCATDQPAGGGFQNFARQAGLIDFGAAAQQAVVPAGQAAQQAATPPAGQTEGRG
jgi:hypothetical protein